MNLSSLVAGDILIDGATNNGLHTMMYVGSNSNGLKGPSIVDAWTQGVTVWSVEVEKGHFGPYFLEEQRLHKKEVHIYRREDGAVSALAAGYALRWATHPSRTLMAPDRRAESKRALGEKGLHEGKKIADTRRNGVTFAQQESFAPPFEYDAFYRVLKWALREEEPFSRNRGTTCCAFVAACYQAAALINAVKGDDKASALKGALENVRNHRNSKTPFTTKDLIPSITRSSWISPSALRGSNPGFKGSEKFEQGQSADFIRDCMLQLTGKPEATIESVLTPAMLVDAKYLHSNKLSERLNGETTSKGWVHHGLLTPA